MPSAASKGTSKRSRTPPGPARPPESSLDARKGNYYLLVLTTLEEGSFCAHYANPDGVVVSLGQFPLAR